MMNLPKWIIPDKFPALYDLESATAVEMVAKLYGSMQTLISEYNDYVSALNKNIDTYEADLTKANDDFKRTMEMFVNNFIECVDVKIDKQDAEVVKAINYMTTNLSVSISEAIDEMFASGKIDEEIARQLAVLNNRINTFTALAEGSTTADAELIDIRNGEDGVVYPSAGEAVRTQLTNVKSDLSDVKMDESFITSVFNERCVVYHNKYASFPSEEEPVSLFDIENCGVIEMDCKLGESLRVAITAPASPYDLIYILTDEQGKIVEYARAESLDCTINIRIPNAKVYFNFVDGLGAIPARIKKNDSPKLAGKTIACFGDSITWYDGQVYNWGKEEGKTAIGYESYLRQMLDMHVHNFGLSGNTMPMILENAIKRTDIDYSIYDYVTITSGANDERCNTPLGTVQPFGTAYDTTTFIGALQSGIDHILSINKDVKILLCTPIMGWIYAPNGYEYERTENGIVTEKWANAIKEVAKAYSLPVCDWYNESGINLWTRINYMNDPEPITHGGDNTYYSLHPTTSGYKRMADLLMGRLKAI